MFCAVWAWLFGWFWVCCLGFFFPAFALLLLRLTSSLNSPSLPVYLLSSPRCWKICVKQECWKVSLKVLEIAGEWVVRGAAACTVWKQNNRGKKREGERERKEQEHNSLVSVARLLFSSFFIFTFQPLSSLCYFFLFNSTNGIYPLASLSSPSAPPPLPLYSAGFACEWKGLLLPL